jgi:hypothetical protein
LWLKTFSSGELEGKVVARPFSSGKYELAS